MECVVRRRHALARGVVRTCVGRQDQGHVISPYIALACLHTHTHIHIHASARPFIVRGLETARFHDYGLDRCGGEPPMNRHHGMVGIGHNEVYVAGGLDV